MNPTKTERDQWRERLSSSFTCFDPDHADFTLRLLHELEEVERELIGRRKECEEVEQTLGKALGYPPYPVLNGMDYSQIPASKTNAQDSPWVNIGDHVPGTIAEEAAQRIAKLEREADVLSFWLANAYIDIDLLPNIESGAMNPPLPEDVREAAREAARKDEIQT